MVREDKTGWVVWTKKGRAPRFFHETQEQAEQEAMRLAALKPGSKFIVMGMVSKFSEEPAAQAA